MKKWKGFHKSSSKTDKFKEDFSEELNRKEKQIFEALEKCIEKKRRNTKTFSTFQIYDNFVATSERERERKMYYEIIDFFEENSDQIFQK